MTNEQIEVANQLEEMNPGDFVDFSTGHQVLKLTAETYEVDGKVLGFYEAYKVVSS